MWFTSNADQQDDVAGRQGRSRLHSHPQHSSQPTRIRFFLGSSHSRTEQQGFRRVLSFSDGLVASILSRHRLRHRLGSRRRQSLAQALPLPRSAPKTSDRWVSTSAPIIPGLLLPSAPVAQPPSRGQFRSSFARHQQSPGSAALRSQQGAQRRHDRAPPSSLSKARVLAVLLPLVALTPQQHRFRQHTSSVRLPQAGLTAQH